MCVALCSHLPNFGATVAGSGAELRGLFLHNAAPRLVSLDHDLHPDDPTDGVMLLRELIAAWRDAPPFVIVHSSNMDRGAIMIGELELAGWPHAHTPAVGDGWIEGHWIPWVSRAIGKSDR